MSERQVGDGADIVLEMIRVLNRANFSDRKNIMRTVAVWFGYQLSENELPEKVRIEE